MQVTVLPTPTDRASLDVMVSVSEPVRDRPRPPLRVRTTHYERELPHLKHLATLGISFHRLQAVRAGFDDVLFAGPDGSVREGSVWNIAFWDGERVVWPAGPLLEGITMQLLRQGLRRLAVPDESRHLTVASLQDMTAAVATNSHCVAQPIAAIDDTNLPDGRTLAELLRRAWQEVVWEPIPTAV